MTRSISTAALSVRCLAATGVLALVVAGCAQPTTADKGAGSPEVFYIAQAESAAELSGAQLWGQTCSRCHSSRSPTAFSDAQWEVVMLHMRIQANLSGEEERKVLEFLKASN